MCQHHPFGIKRLGRAVWFLANSCVLPTQRRVFDSSVLRFSAPAAEGSARRAQAKSFALQMWKRTKGTASWLPSLCWSRDAFRDAALLVSNEEGALAFFVLYACQQNQTALFLLARRFQLVVLALIRVSGKKAVNAWENHHESMFGYDHGT